MYSLYETFSKEKVSLAYYGVFADDITEMLVDLSETYITKTEHLTKLSRKASFLITESFQNLIRHGIIEKQSISEIQHNKDFYQISIIDDRIIICSANVIEHKNVDNLDAHIDKINALTPKQIKDLYRQILSDGTLSSKGGAGLGLIEMVRKTGLPLQKKFVALSEGYSLLLLGLEIPISSDIKESKINMDSLEKLYKHLAEDGLLLLYKGDFSNSSNTNLIKILNNNFLINDEIDPTKLKNIVAIIEVMQNVSKHGKLIHGLKEGIFAIKELDGELFIECSNFVSKTDYINLKNKLEVIKSYSIDELEKLYKQKMANSYLSDDDNAGLGLIEIARFTKNTFSYCFVETPEKDIFYSIIIKTV